MALEIDEEDGRSLESKMQQLVGKLYEQMDHALQLQKQIRKHFDGLSYALRDGKRPLWEA